MSVGNQEAPRRPSLRDRILARDHGILLFAVTPPAARTPPSRMSRIAASTVDRVSSLDIDGLIVYDVVDESDRIEAERPFPFVPSADPAEYHRSFLPAWRRPVVIYRSVGKYTRRELGDWLTSIDVSDVLSVFVGASSSAKAVLTDLTSAQALRRELAPELLLGAVAIPERHLAHGDEQLRMLAKQESGCGFFVSQVVYDVGATRRLLSDYANACEERSVEPVPIILTLSICGSSRTLDFLHWLGVSVPGAAEAELRHADDPLSVSSDQCHRIAHELIDFGRRLGLPVGFNVESVSSHEAEIDAAVALAHRLRATLDGDRHGDRDRDRNRDPDPDPDVDSGSDRGVEESGGETR